LRKKKSDKRKRELEVKHMEVNWDEIERQYEEVPYRATGQYHLIAESASSPSSKDDSTTVVGDINHQNTTPISYNNMHLIPPMQSTKLTALFLM
jgi:hypothetical protein